jgi:calcium-dependent protein kinase
MKSLDHPNIIRILDVYEDTRSFHIVTDLCKAGELFDYIVETRCLSE